MAQTTGERRVLITFPVRGPQRVPFEEALRGVARVDVLADLQGEERRAALRDAEVLLTWFWGRELSPEDREALGSVRLVQLISAGADSLPVDDVPAEATIASNVGAYADPMAEHVLAMTLALAKRFPQNHAALARGEFNQFAFTRSLRGAACGILGFGGIGQASARLFRAFGARIHAINTTGRTDQAVEFIGTLDDLDSVLSASDVLLISLPLTRRTHGLIGRRELELMKTDASVVNVARGAILDEGALYEHLRTHPEFMAGIDAWWSEPLGQGEFRTAHPFFDLPNVLGSPHNSALVPGAIEEAARWAAENVLRYLRGGPIRGVVDRADYASP
jgi:phosphoglycerate dehydrogenase-like enzyme